jgi:hypothetical protein
VVRYVLGLFTGLSSALAFSLRLLMDSSEFVPHDICSGQGRFGQDFLRTVLIPFLHTHQFGQVQ